MQFNHPPNKKLLRDLFKTYGIRVAMGDFLGAYTIGSGAAWAQGTDYRDPEQRAAMMRSVEDMVREFRDEPFLLFYILGNENNYRLTHTNAIEFPEEYAKFVNQAARRIHELDPHHPVVLSNGETRLLKVYAEHTPDIDILGLNSYRRPGFETLWKEVKSDYDKPVVMTEFGILPPRVVNGALDQDDQERAHRAAWNDIEKNGIGGFAFAWMDFWWYDGEPWKHNASGQNNEWHGLFGQGDGEHSPLIRQPRKAYAMYERLWND